MYAAIGVTVVELERGADGWRAVRNPAPGQGRNRGSPCSRPFSSPAPPPAIPGLKPRRPSSTPLNPIAAAAKRQRTRCAAARGQLRRRAHAVGHDLTAEENFHSVFYSAEQNPAPAVEDEDYARDARLFRYPGACPRLSLAAPVSIRRQSVRACALWLGA